MLLEEMLKTDERVFWQVILPYRYVALDAVSLRCFWTESETPAYACFACQEDDRKFDGVYAVEGLFAPI